MIDLLALRQKSVKQALSFSKDNTPQLVERHALGKCFAITMSYTLWSYKNLLGTLSRCLTIITLMFFTSLYKSTRKKHKKGVESSIFVATEARQSQSINKYERPTP